MHAPLPDRAAWWRLLVRIVDPVFTHLAAHTLRARMPVQNAPGGPDRTASTHLEALGRALAGAAPWLEAPGLEGDEAAARDVLRAKVLAALANALDPASPDHLRLDTPRQALVDAAFLVHGLLRAPSLGRDLDAATRTRLDVATASARVIAPPHNNWLLFAALVEAWRCAQGLDWDRMRVDYALRQHEAWYLGDGRYADGVRNHEDYYNSFVIHPLLHDTLAVAASADRAWLAIAEQEDRRFRRFAAVQERQIATDGTFPPVGRSLAYRCGAFQALAQAALLGKLPASVPPGAARGALGAVIGRTLLAPGTFDDAGWLRPGLGGHQPHLAESYISTGSLYLCTTAFLPLGLGADTPFWTDPALPWTQVRVWSGRDEPADHAMD